MDDPVGALAGADQAGVARADAVRVAQPLARLALGVAVFDVELRPKRTRDPRHVGHRLLVHGDQVQARSCVGGCGGADLGEGVEHAFDAERPADAGDVGAAELGDEPVVPTAATEGGLGADAGGVDLERGAPVIIEAADDRRVDLERHAPVAQERSDGVEVRPGGGAQVVEGPRQAVDQGAVARVLGVEQPHGVEAQPLLAGGREFVGPWRERLAQVRVVPLAVFGVAHRAQGDGGVLEPQRAQHVDEQGDRLGVRHWFGTPDDFEVDLVELPEASALHVLGAERRAVAPQLHRGRPGVHAVLHVGAEDARGELGAQREAATPPIVEGVHLLLNDQVRGFADAALEDLGELEHGCRQLPHPGTLQHAPGDVVHAAPTRLIGGEAVGGAFDGLESHPAESTRPFAVSWPPARQRPHPWWGAAAGSARRARRSVQVGGQTVARDPIDDHEDEAGGQPVGRLEHDAGGAPTGGGHHRALLAVDVRGHEYKATVVPAAEVAALQHDLAGVGPNRDQRRDHVQRHLSGRCARG